MLAIMADNDVERHVQALLRVCSSRWVADRQHGKAVSQVGSGGTVSALRVAPGQHDHAIGLLGERAAVEISANLEPREAGQPQQ